MRAAILAVVLLAALAATPGRCAPGGEIPQGPLTLEECTAIALVRNPQIIASEQGVVTGQAGLTRARSSYYPQLSLSAVEGITSGTSTPSLSDGDDTREELDLTLRMTLWRQGRRESVGESNASLRAADWSHAATIQGLVEQVARDYYEVLAARQLLGVAEAGVESARGHRDEVKARIAAGDVADVDVFPAEDDLARAQLDVIDARSNVRLALARLKNSMGVPPETALELAEAPAPREEEIPSLGAAMRTALESRPEVLGGRASARASRYGLAQAKIARGPVADLSGQYSQRYQQWEERDPSWDLALSLSWPLFDGQATKADETAARARLRRSEADLERVTSQVGLEVENAVVEVERARERTQAAETSVAAAEARLAAAEGKYWQGVGILLEVIDARVAVTNARANRVRARYDHQIALVALRGALGTLGLPEGGEATP